MFLRRMFARKESNSVDDSSCSGSTTTPADENRQTANSRTQQHKQLNRRTQNLSSAGSQRPGSVLQLTPLWEHILRTRTLPDTVSPMEMFAEFLERLRDAEWQVRQHALRVLVDVLVVIGPKADAYMGPLVPQLVENLGHQAPTVRKGALDCLRVYLAETAMPDTILLQILDIGLNQKITNEPFGGRLTCGVMLSLPALVQSTLHTVKRNYILRNTIDMLTNKMGQVTHQEITLKVLCKIRELIGNREFAEYMSHGAYREFELLCSIYGVGECKELNSSTKSWRMMATEPDVDLFPGNQSDNYWRSSDEEKMLEFSGTPTHCNASKEKIIMETEIKINNDTLTMRILEEKDDSEAPDTYPSSIEDDIVSGPSRETTGIIHVLSDSEVEEINQKPSHNYSNPTPDTPRTPKRVTFGGEVVKMRTPDSDATVTNDESRSTNDTMQVLSVEIPNDNTKPIPQSSQSSQSSLSRPKSAQIHKLDSSDSAATTPTTENPPKDTSPRSPFKRLSVSSVDNIVSPKTPHKEIEVLHNLQREPSPVRVRRASIRLDDGDEFGERVDRTTTEQPKEPKEPPKSWEELGIVSDEVLMDLRSGDWRLRSNGIYALEEALRSSDNLALVQPSLDSLLRTLLSSERNPEVAEDKRRVLINLISRLPLDNLEDRTVQIITGLCRQGGPGANRASKALMQRLPPAVIVLKLISDDFLHAKSSRFRENALQMVMYALMTFPSTCFDTNTCVTSATLAAMDRKKRVRQAALDVLAILGQVTSPRVVLEIVENIAASMESGNDLFAAVKARLSRKQLPLVSADGCVQYTLRVPSPQSLEKSSGVHLGADLEWIASGVGSVSPTSLKRRAHRYRNQLNGGQSFNYAANSYEETGKYRSPHELLALGVAGNDVNTEYAASDDNHYMGNNNNMPYILGKTVPLQYTSTKSIRNGGAISGGGVLPGAGDIIGINGKRIATKSCSDSSVDGRSSDSTYTSSSSNGGLGISGRYARQSGNSRFPAMERIDLSGHYLLKPAHKNSFVSMTYVPPNPMHFNSTYPKMNYTVQQRKHGTRSNRPHYTTQDTFDESSYGEECSGYAAAVEKNHHSNHGTGNSSRRFVNVEKFIQSNKTAQQSPSNGIIVPPSPHLNRTPHDAQSVNESPKSQTRSIDSDKQKETPIETASNGIVMQKEDDEDKPYSTPKTTVVTTVQSSPNGVDLNSSAEHLREQAIVKTPTESTKPEAPQEEVKPDTPRPPSTASTVREKMEPDTKSIKSENNEDLNTADTPDYESQTITPISRPQSVQSMKSLVIEEELDCEPSSITDQDKVSEVTQEILEDLSDVEDPLQNPQESASPIRELPTDLEPNNEDNIPPSPPPSPTIEQIKALSRKSSFAKSSESLYERQHSKLDLDNSTETSSDYQSSQLNNTLTEFIPVKPQHTPLQRKSKTSYFGKNHRRVSPVKQSIKMTQAELFPQSMARFDKPRDALNKTFDQLDSPNWEVVVFGLKSMVRLMRYHPETLDNQMHITCIQLSKSVRNLRSQVSRAACQASTELFTMKSKFLEQECDDLVCALLHRTADTNRFLRADANRGLESMCDNLTPQKVLNILCTKGALHQNALVRTTAAKLLNRLADRLGCEKIFTMGRDNRDKFILTGANLLLEGSLETRCYAKSLFRTLSNHQNYSRLLLEVIPTRIYRNIEKSLKNIR